MNKRQVNRYVYVCVRTSFLTRERARTGLYGLQNTLTSDL